jgi:cation diffusion facilitator CzcD-associated flavoprotein CzcO
MAIRLREEGITDFVMLEKADDVGGTWRDNTYPGCRCDVPSHLYSFSFAPNPGWSRTFSPQPEIWDYLRGVARDYDLYQHIRFGTEVREVAWDDDAQHWTIDTSDGEYTADVLVSGMGGLHVPSIPHLPGIESFEGTTFHSAEWNHEHDLKGERVAVIGTGASAIQFVPRIQPDVERLTVFQRTPPWIMPLPDRPLKLFESRLYKRFPPAQLAMRATIYWARELFVIGFMKPELGDRMAGFQARKYLRESVPDPVLRAKVTPAYTIGCKRVLISDDYYPALAQPNVDVVTAGIREVRANAIIDSDGLEHQVDTIIYGTGFRVTDMQAADHVIGRDGRRLGEVFAGSPNAHRGTTFTGFPNLFMMVGPNTGLGHNSIVFMIESQLNYIASALRYLSKSGAASVEPRREVQEEYNRSLDERLEGTVWNAGGCVSWYLDDNGRNSTLWPGFTWRFRRELRRFDPAEYAVRSPRRVPDPVPAAA